jgi:hypothetical protein
MTSGSLVAASQRNDAMASNIAKRAFSELTDFDLTTRGMRSLSSGRTWASQ